MDDCLRSFAIRLSSLLRELDLPWLSEEKFDEIGDKKLQLGLHEKYLSSCELNWKI